VPSLASRPGAQRRAVRGSGFSAEVRYLTRTEHERVEQVVDLPGRLVTAEDLAAVLRLWERVWQDVAWWASAASGSWPAAGSGASDASTTDPSEVTHSDDHPGPGLVLLATAALARLAEDLTDLDDLAHLTRPCVGQDGPTGSGGPMAHLLTTVAGVWGLNYVLRGAQIGGRILAPQIAGRLHLPEGVALRYFSTAGEDVGSSWVGFRRRLDAWGNGATPAQRRAVVAAAIMTFHAVQDRALETLVPPRAVRDPEQPADYPQAGISTDFKEGPS
jgi:heme oxygenase